MPENWVSVRLDQPLSLGKLQGANFVRFVLQNHNFDEVNDKNQWRKILLILRFLGSFEEKDPCRPARQLSYSKILLSMY